MRITRGKLLDQFATLFDIDPDEVVVWASSYVNQPELFTNTEATEKERFASIKAYVESRISQASDTRIRRTLLAEAA